MHLLTHLLRADADPVNNVLANKSEEERVAVTEKADDDKKK